MHAQYLSNCVQRIVINKMSAPQTETPPAYLNAEYIKRALESHFNGIVGDRNKNVVDILDCHWKRAMADGENFCSVIYRVKVHFLLYSAGAENSSEKREITVIVKDVIREISELGSNELAMYRHALPEMQQILAQTVRENKNEAMKIKLYANCFFCERDEREIYVLEDLNEADYRSVDRYAGLNLQEAKVVLKKLAQFHAASMKYIEKFPVETAALLPSTFDNALDDDVFFNAIALGGIRAASKVVGEWVDFEDIAAKMRLSLDKFDVYAKRIMQKERCRFKVITHGDLWANNILMKYVTVEGVEVPEDAVFVDFQMDFVGSCGYDLNFFLNTSVQLTILKLHRYELLRYYYTNLKATLRNLGTQDADIPSWQMVMEEIRDLEFISYYAMVCELPLCCMDREGSQGLTLNCLIDPATQAATHKLMYENKRVLEMLHYGLDRLNELGVLDL